MATMPTSAKSKPGMLPFREQRNRVGRECFMVVVFMIINRCRYVKFHPRLDKGNPAHWYETKGGCVMRGLVAPLELVAYLYYLRRRRAARPARASSESVAVVGSGTIFMLKVGAPFEPTAPA